MSVAVDQRGAAAASAAIADLTAEVAELRSRMQRLEEAQRQQPLLPLPGAVVPVRSPTPPDLRPPPRVEHSGDAIRKPESVSGRAEGKVAAEAAPANGPPAEQLDQDEVGLSMSVWDASLLIGLEPVGLLGSFWLAVLLAFNVALQGMFVFVVQRSLSAADVDEGTVEDFLAWRRGAAHDASNLDSNIGSAESLARRVCRGDGSLTSSASQAGAYEVLWKYVGFEDGTVSSGALGPVMCILCLFVFIVTVSKEFNELLDMCGALLSLPRGPVTRLTLEGGELCVEQLSRRRAACCACVLMLRAAICILLLGYGTLFLALHTVAIGDLLLNALALEFIFSLDDLLFEALAPARVRRIVDQAQPLAPPPSPLGAGRSRPACCLNTAGLRADAAQRSPAVPPLLPSTLGQPYSMSVSTEILNPLSV
eukprot:COSAG01_NODE_469_length_16584_cov_10.725265_7_plen_423_part_00